MDVLTDSLNQTSATSQIGKLRRQGSDYCTHCHVQMLFTDVLMAHHLLALHLTYLLTPVRSHLRHHKASPHTLAVTHTTDEYHRRLCTSWGNESRPVLMQCSWTDPRPSFFPPPSHNTTPLPSDFSVSFAAVFHSQSSNQPLNLI